jgi:hypothetical protein
MSPTRLMRQAALPALAILLGTVAGCTGSATIVKPAAQQASSLPYYPTSTAPESSSASATAKAVVLPYRPPARATLAKPDQPTVKPAKAKATVSQPAKTVKPTPSAITPVATPPSPHPTLTHVGTAVFTMPPSPPSPVTPPTSPSGTPTGHRGG